MASVDHSSAYAEWAVVFFGVLNTALDNTRVRIISERTGGAIKTGLARARASASGQASGVAEAAGGALQPYTVGAVVACGADLNPIRIANRRRTSRVAFGVVACFAGSRYGST